MLGFLCESQASLYAALGLRVVGGVPFRGLLSADAVYLRSLFFVEAAEPEGQKPQKEDAKRTEKEGGTAVGMTRDSQLLAARRCLFELQNAGLTVWADAREIQQVQMTREQLHQHLLQQQASPQQHQQMLQELEEASLYIPGLVAVQRLQDAAAVGASLATEYLKETAGIALVADGTETQEEFDAVVGRPVRLCSARSRPPLACTRSWLVGPLDAIAEANESLGHSVASSNRLSVCVFSGDCVCSLLQNLLCVLVRPADRAAAGVAAARRVSELLRQAERTEQGEGLQTTGGCVPVIQWIEAPPPALLPNAAGGERQQGSEKEHAPLSDSQAVSRNSRRLLHERQRAGL